MYKEQVTSLVLRTGGEWVDWNGTERNRIEDTRGIGEARVVRKEIVKLMENEGPGDCIWAFTDGSHHPGTGRTTAAAVVKTRTRS
jgi:hypothetical protein